MRKFNPLTLAIGGLLFLITGLIAGYQVLVEQKIVSLPEACKKNKITLETFEAFQKQLVNQPSVSCDKIQFELFGISMAGYNFLLCLTISLIIIFYLIKKHNH